ncbi:hypothetical protein [Actinomadura syzygii]|uniref:hypothetical protein n=1 Tax=Actinomadura syzygii TaxID=1427538 RepID=UPI0016524E7D|nr:hypothetical protein [Actinomadura syzygii]
MRSRSAGSILAGLGAVALIGTATPPVTAAEPTADPSGGASGTPSGSPSDPPGGTPSETPSDPPKTDPPKTDPPKTDPPKTDPPKTDPPKTDPPKTDPPKTDPPKTDPPKTDPPKTDPPTTPPTKPPTTGRPTKPPAKPPTKPKTPVLSLGLTVSSATVRPGGSVTATVKVASANATATGAVLRLSASGGSVGPPTRSLGGVGGGGVSAQATVRAPSDAKPGVITLRADVSAAKAKGASGAYKLIVTDPGGAPPPGVSLANLPPGVPPLTPSGFDPLAGVEIPQVALPPVAPPQVAPEQATGPFVPVASLHTLPGKPFTLNELGALQAGFLAAMSSAVTLLLLRLRLARRAARRRDAVRPGPVLVPRAALPPRSVRRRLVPAGRPLTAARLRTLPPQPAHVRSVRMVWTPAR